MKKIVNILYFYCFTFVRSSKYVMPLALLILLQMSLYIIARGEALDFINSLFLAEIFAFTIAIWLGYTSSGWIDEVTEQLLILRIKSDVLYHSIYCLFLLVVSVFISLISILIPTIFHLFDSGLFQQFNVIYFSYSFLLFLGSSFAGISLGALFHPRIMVDKNEVSLYVSVVGLVSITRHSIVNQYEIFQYLLWLFPNVSAHHSIIIDSSQFTFLIVVRLFLFNMLYGLAYSLIKILLLSRKKF